MGQWEARGWRHTGKVWDQDYGKSESLKRSKSFLCLTTVAFIFLQSFPKASVALSAQQLTDMSQITITITMATTLTRPTTAANQHPVTWCCRYQGLQYVKNPISDFSSGSSQLPFAVGIHKARSLGLFFGPKIPKFLSWFWNDLPDTPKQQQHLLWAQNLLQLPCPWPRPSKHLWQGNVLWPVGELDLFLSVCSKNGECIFLLLTFSNNWEFGPPFILLGNA